MRKIKLLDFIDKYMRNAGFVVWCPSFSNILYDSEDVFEPLIVRESDTLCIFDYFIVDDICTNGGWIQINCHFNKRKWNRDAKALERSQEFSQLSIDDFLGDDQYVYR